MVIPQTAQGQLLSVSCAASRACEGVGQTVDARGNTRAVAEAWNGSRWTAQTVPSFDDPVTSLTSVSCSGPDSCDAIGSFQGNTSGGVFGEYWDGSTWTIQLMPGVSSGTVFLNAISCAAANACTAVGFEVNNQTGVEAPLVEVWNGSAWHVQKSPTPAGAAGAELTGVSCASATACTAVGDFQKSRSQLPFAESRATSTWQLETVPLPAGTLAAFPSAVSCSAADDCTAVGTYATQTQELSLAERWNGFAWSLETVPTPAGAFATTLSSVSCTSASDCEAVGGAVSQTGSGPLAERWNGSTWSVQTTPTETGGFLAVVSCPSSGSCTAIGSPGATGAPARLRPGSQLPRPGLLSVAPRVSSLGLRSLRAASGSPSRRSPSVYALAVAAPLFGRSADRQLRTAGAPSLTLAEQWNGTSWSVVPVPGFTGAASSQPFGVSCGSAHSCFATGYYTDSISGDQLPLLERWSGSRWTLASLPIPSGTVDTRLFDVSCTAANACTAVGEALTHTTATAFADRWNGITWTAQHVPGKAGLGSALGSVSCTAANACTAVGALLNRSTGEDSTLAEFWNGSTWTVQPTPGESGSSSSDLFSVSCTSADACMSAGGFSKIGSSGGVLSELWSGGQWTLKSLPSPSNPQVSIPNSVSCAAPNACTAVGSWLNRTPFGFFAFADGWNGTRWSPQKVPTALSDLFGVGCVTSTACVAAGDANSAVWNGTSWSVQPLAPPLFGQFPSIQGLTCTQHAICTGVGTATTSQPIPLAERYS
jgi:hypothetical protein